MSEPIALFAELIPEHLQFISGKGVTRTYPKHTVLISEGDDSEAFYVIGSGRVKVYASDENGKEVILNIQGPGEYFGELALIDDAPRSASVITLEKCTVSVVSKTDFYHSLSERPEIALELIRPLVNRIRSLTESVKNLALLDVYGRVARTLLNLAKEKDGDFVIEQRLTHQDIANMVGASREMVSRIMKDLATGGYIRVANRKIYVKGKLPPAW
jgi:CRP/FNR family cyclic AMP-dependent transcriptional regulator